MNIAFFGSSDSAHYCLDHLLKTDYAIKLVVTQPERPSGRGKKLLKSSLRALADEHSIPVIQPVKIRKDPSALELLKNIEPDLNVVVSYGQILPASIIYLPRFNSINLHFSLLPSYRGASPVQWALLNGETVTGISIFELNEKMDEGPLYLQEKVNIEPGENALQLKMRLTRIGAALLGKVIADMGSYKPVDQDHSSATYAPLIKKENGRIRWNNPADRIDRHVRAFFPWPSSFFYLNQKRIIITRGSIASHGLGSQGNPGEIIAISKQGMEVACLKGSYCIEELRPENKKAMSAYAYSIGARLKPGERCE